MSERNEVLEMSGGNGHQFWYNPEIYPNGPLRRKGTHRQAPLLQLRKMRHRRHVLARVLLRLPVVEPCEVAALRASALNTRAHTGGLM